MVILEVRLSASVSSSVGSGADDTVEESMKEGTLYSDPVPVPSLGAHGLACAACAAWAEVACTPDSGLGPLSIHCIHSTKQRCRNDVGGHAGPFKHSN